VIRPLPSTPSSTATPPSQLHPLSLHDALPISLVLGSYGLDVLPARWWAVALLVVSMFGFAVDVQIGVPRFWTGVGVVTLVVGSRSEEHTSELQSRENLVCRLLLEKKKSKDKTF